MITRRGLLRSLLAAPIVITTPGLLMPARGLPFLWADGLHDDTRALQARIDQASGTFTMPDTALSYLISAPLVLRDTAFFGRDATLITDTPGPILVVTGRASGIRDLTVWRRTRCAPAQSIGMMYINARS